jgi:hypothetical protein
VRPSLGRPKRRPTRFPIKCGDFSDPIAAASDVAAITCDDFCIALRSIYASIDIGSRLKALTAGEVREY